MPVDLSASCLHQVGVITNFLSLRLYPLFITTGTYLADIKQLVLLPVMGVLCCSLILLFGFLFPAMNYILFPLIFLVLVIHWQLVVVYVFFFAAIFVLTYGVLLLLGYCSMQILLGSCPDYLESLSLACFWLYLLLLLLCYCSGCGTVSWLCGWILILARNSS